MESPHTFTIVLVLLLCFGSTGVCSEPTLYKGCLSNTCVNYTCKYGSSRILYYSNSVATFQLLLQAGDISPNPGPELNKPSNSHRDNAQADNVLDRPRMPTKIIRYDTALLHSINPPCHISQYQRLPCDVWKTITDLGIARVKKTRRSKKKPKEDLIASPNLSLISESCNQSEDLLFIKEKGLRISHLNICSLTSKLDYLRSLLQRGNIDIFTLSETHLDDTVSDAELKIDNYKLERVDRNRRGGGVCVYIIDNLTYIRRLDLESHELEALWIEIKLPNTKPILTGTFYRPPRSDAVYQGQIEESISRVTELNQEVIVLGDFNYNMHCKNESKFIDKLCRQNSMHQIVKGSTRITETSSTLIDIILTNLPNNVCMSKVVSLGLSDHNLVYIVRKLYRPKVPPKVITFRSMKQFNEKSFQDDMEKLDWNECLNSDDIVTAWSTWKVNFLRVCDKHTPLVTRRVRGNKTKWVTDEYISLTHLRDRLKKRAEKQNTNSIWSQYRSVRNYVNNLRTTLKSRYYHDSVIENQRNHKQLWNVLKELNPGKKDNRSKISGLKVNDNVDTDKEHIANELNGFFVSIGASINSKQTVNSSNMKDYIPDLPACNFEFTEVNEEYVLKELKKLQTGKATGFDMVSAQLLKAAAPVICKHLTYLFNLSLISSELPSDWKQAKVSPIHKGGDRTDKNNYRPISVISVVMKILERIVHDQLQQHFVKYNLLAPQQSGFRKGHSTDTVLSYFSDYLLKHMDQGNLTGVVFLDFRKAFDSVNHHVLLQKLQMYGVRGAALVWFKNYLEDRKQKTVIDGTESDWGKIDTGVPQGSILGPLLFSIMVNDLPHVVHKCKIMLYADDAVLFYSSPYPDEIEETLNTELQNVYKWVNDNGLALNLLKTQFMLFGSSNNLLKITKPISLSVVCGWISAHPS